MYRNLKKYFIVFGNVQLTKGVRRCMLVDTYRTTYHLIPIALFQILKKYKHYLISEIYKKYSRNEWPILDEYFDFLSKKDLIYLTSFKSDLKIFKPMSLQWDYYGMVSNSVMEFKSMNEFRTREFVIKQLDKLDCMYLQLFFFCPIHYVDLEDIALTFEESEFRSIEIFSHYSQTFDSKQIDIFFLKYQRISNIVFYKSPRKSTDNYLQGFSSVIYSTQDNMGALACGNISPNYFSPTVSHFTESQHHNTCLNRKISIDLDGEIKNCPSMAKSYGNIRDTGLIEVVNNPEFQKVWHIKKDEITKCKDCEFRHICTDCRAYLENPEDQFSKPLKCGYDPYTGDWEKWDDNPLKQNAIEFYGMQELK